MYVLGAGWRKQPIKAKSNKELHRKRTPARWGERMEESGAQPGHSDTHLMSVFVLFAMDGGKSSSAIFPGHDGTSNKELR
jgi:hypothetical protein